MSKSKKKIVIGGLAASASLVTLVSGIIISVVIAGTGVLIIRNPELFDGSVSHGNKPSEPSVSGEYFDEYARKIQTLDLEKLRQDNPSKETDPGMYTGTRNIAEEFEMYLLLAEICQRPEINPIYSGESNLNAEDKWLITPGMLYGIWYHESGMSQLGYQMDGEAARGYHMWDPTAYGNFGGPCGQNLSMDAKMVTGDYRMHMYISRFESPDMPDELRAICGSGAEIQSGQGHLPDGTSVSWDQISQYVKFTENVRPSPRFVADSLYSEARALRQMMSGMQAWGKTNAPHAGLVADKLKVLQWCERLGTNETNSGYLGFLWASSYFSQQARLTRPPEYTSDVSEVSDDNFGGLYRIYLQMVASGVPLDFWAIRDPTWCPPAKIGDATRDMSTVMTNINDVLFGASVRNKTFGAVGSNGSGIIQKLDAQGGSIFPNLEQGLVSALEYTRNHETYGANVATQSPFPIEVLNGGNWIQSSIWKMVDVYYGNEKYTLPPEKLPDWVVEPGQVSQDPTGGPYTEYVGDMPRITAPNAVGRKGNKWFITPGVLTEPITGAVVVGYDYHGTSCGHGHDHSTYGHPGLDLGGGGTIKAVADGVVIRTRRYDKVQSAAGGFGTYTVILHCVNGNYFCSVYAHMQPKSFNLHAAGDHVKKGEVIGYVGETGNAYGAHCHFQLNYNLSSGNNGSWGYGQSYTWDPRWSIPTIE